MNVSSISRMHVEVTRQLHNYRRNKARVGRRSVGRPIGGTLRSWISVIEASRAYIAKHDPQKERFMSRLYGLDTPIPPRIGTSERLLRIRRDFAVSESTLYKWRKEVEQVVLCAAIEAGLMQPFGGTIAKKPARSGAIDAHKTE